MKFWRAKRSVRALRIGSTFSLLLFAALAWAGPYANLEAKLSQVQSPKRALQLSESLAGEDETLQALRKDLSKGEGGVAGSALNDLKSYVDTRAKVENLSVDSIAKSQAAQIKASPLYVDDRRQSANWFYAGLKAAWRWVKNLFGSKTSDTQTPNFKFPGLLGPWIYGLVWAVLAGLIAVFGYFAIRQIHWRANLKRRAKAILDEDEPERTVDEWLQRADDLQRQGLHREAVRCLYLACLLRFDEARVARFVRSETNWEHLRRISASPRLPLGLDFEPVTQAFDRIWYGMRIDGEPDVRLFKTWYTQITQAVAEVAA